MNAREIGKLRRQEIEALVDRYGGAITPAQVVAFAEDPTTALHGLFEWDDSEAAKRYREVQAEQYLRVTVTVLKSEGQDTLRIRAFVSLPSDRGENGYRRTVDVMQDAGRKAELLQHAELEYRRYRQRYRHLEELSALFVAGDAVFSAEQVAA